MCIHNQNITEEKCPICSARLRNEQLERVKEKYKLEEGALKAWVPKFASELQQENIKAAAQYSSEVQSILELDGIENDLYCTHNVKFNECKKCLKTWRSQGSFCIPETIQYFMQTTSQTETNIDLKLLNEPNDLTVSTNPDRNGKGKNIKKAFGFHSKDLTSPCGRKTQLFYYKTSGTEKCTLENDKSSWMLIRNTLEMQRLLSGQLRTHALPPMAIQLQDPRKINLKKQEICKAHTVPECYIWEAVAFWLNGSLNDESFLYMIGSLFIPSLDNIFSLEMLNAIESMFSEVLSLMRTCRQELNPSSKCLLATILANKLTQSPYNLSFGQAQADSELLGSGINVFTINLDEITDQVIQRYINIVSQGEVRGTKFAPITTIILSAWGEFINLTAGAPGKQPPNQVYAGNECFSLDHDGRVQHSRISTEQFNRIENEPKPFIKLNKLGKISNHISTPRELAAYRKACIVFGFSYIRSVCKLDNLFSLITCPKCQTGDLYEVWKNTYRCRCCNHVLKLPPDSKLKSGNSLSHDGRRMNWVHRQGESEVHCRKCGAYIGKTMTGLCYSCSYPKR
jgi:hypothetical protein